MKIVSSEKVASRLTNHIPRVHARKKKTMHAHVKGTLKYSSISILFGVWRQQYIWQDVIEIEYWIEIKNVRGMKHPAYRINGISKWNVVQLKRCCNWRPASEKKRNEINDKRKEKISKEETFWKRHRSTHSKDCTTQTEPSRDPTRSVP